MEHAYRSAATAKLIAVTLLLLAQACALPAMAADDSLERERLTVITRQLDLINRLADQAAAVAPKGHRRYHLDYGRLHADVQRIRASVQDYLVPQRAQPRDPVPLTGTYNREAIGGTEASRP